MQQKTSSYDNFTFFWAVLSLKGNWGRNWWNPVKPPLPCMPEYSDFKKEIKNRRNPNRKSIYIICWRGFWAYLIIVNWELKLPVQSAAAHTCMLPNRSQQIHNPSITVKDMKHCTHKHYKYTKKILWIYLYMYLNRFLKLLYIPSSPNCSLILSKSDPPTTPTLTRRLSSLKNWCMSGVAF